MPHNGEGSKTIEELSGKESTNVEENNKYIKKFEVYDFIDQIKMHQVGISGLIDNLHTVGYHNSLTDEHATSTAILIDCWNDQLTKIIDGFAKDNEI